MKRIYHHYEKWEDYKNGMYKTDTTDNGLVDFAASLLSDPKRLKQAMKTVTEKWPLSTEFNLTNLDSNRRAWLGWAACCIEHQTPEILTRVAWNSLTDLERIKANEVATQIIEEWEICHLNKINNYAQASFRF